MHSTPLSSAQPKLASAAAGTRTRRIAIIICLVIFEALLISPQLKHNDFDQYWAGANIFLHHGNPYSPAALYKLERSAGMPPRRVIMLMIPPWIIPLIAPLGWLSYTVARTLWFATGLLLVILSGEILWNRYRAHDAFVPDGPLWLPLVLATAFVPNLSALVDCQILPVILFSLAVFLALCDTRHQSLTGFSLLLGLGIKPHLTYLVAVAVLIWIWEQRRWTAFLACCGGFIFLCAITVAVAPTAFAGYRFAEAETRLVVSGFGGLLRSMFGMQRYWLQFTPLIPGFLWFAWYRRRLSGWNWNRHLPALLLASVVMCAYGWWYDQALLTIALVPGVLMWRRMRERPKHWLLAAFLVVAAAQAATPMFSLGAWFYLWTGPALALLYYIAIRITGNQTACISCESLPS